MLEDHSGFGLISIVIKKGKILFLRINCIRIGGMAAGEVGMHESIDFMALMSSRRRTIVGNILIWIIRSKEQRWWHNSYLFLLLYKRSVGYFGHAPIFYPFLNEMELKEVCTSACTSFKVKMEHLQWKGVRGSRRIAI